ncbi:retrovirus-related pol polyprotein from transposon TNT 1-94 [Tanacetum coccineum]
MATMVENVITAGAENRPPMLEKGMYDEIKCPQRLEDLTPEEKLRKSYDIKATNIILLGLPVDIYTLVNHHQTAKAIWDQQQDFLADGLEEFDSDYDDLELNTTSIFKADHVDAFDSDCNEEPTASAIFTARLSPAGSVNGDDFNPTYETYSLRALLGKTPYELLRGRKPTLDYFKVFGSKCFILNTKDYLTKFDLKSYKDEEAYAIKATEKKILENNIEDETLEIDEVVNIKNKLDDNGVVSCNKSRLVAQGYNQQEGIDYDETYVLVARLESIRILLACACALDFKLFQMDVKSTILSGFINEEVYVAQPPGFFDFKRPDHVYKLKKALYGLKQVPKAWYDRLKAFIIKHEYNMGIVGSFTE